jgi:hypothetical protein
VRFAGFQTVAFPETHCWNAHDPGDDSVGNKLQKADISQIFRRLHVAVPSFDFDASQSALAFRSALEKRLIKNIAADGGVERVMSRKIQPNR